MTRIDHSFRKVPIADAVVVLQLRISCFFSLVCLIVGILFLAPIPPHHNGAMAADGRSIPPGNSRQHVNPTNSSTDSFKEDIQVGVVFGMIHPLVNETRYDLPENGADRLFFKPMPLPCLGLSCAATRSRLLACCHRVVNKYGVLQQYGWVHSCSFRIKKSSAGSLRVRWRSIDFRYSRNFFQVLIFPFLFLQRGSID